MNPQIKPFVWIFGGTMAALTIFLFSLVMFNFAYEAGLSKGLDIGVYNCDPYLPNYPLAP